MYTRTPRITLIVLFAAILAIASDFFLFLGTLTIPTAWLSLAAALILTTLIKNKLPSGQTTAKEEEMENEAEKRPLELVPIFAWTLAAGLYARTLFLHPVTIAVRSPFDVVPISVLLFLGIMFGAALLLEKSRARFTDPVTLATLLAALAFLPILYPLGYGFDQLLHEAAETEIVRSGAIAPLPILYGGEYGLIASLALMTKIPVAFLNHWLVPTLSALLLFGAGRAANRGTGSHFVLPLVFLLPLASFTFTTPFALATLFFFATLLVTTFGGAHERRLLGIPFAIASAAVHLIAGIPALLVICFFELKTKPQRSIFAIFGMSAVPIALLANAALRRTEIHWSFSLAKLQNLFTLPNLLPTYRGAEDIAYAAGLLCITFAVAAILVALKEQAERKRYSQQVVLAMCFAISGAVLLCMDIEGVIAYEQGDFGGRLMLLAILCLFPIISAGALRLFHTVQEKNIRLEQFLFLILLVGGALGNWYLLFPHQDKHEISRGFNVSSDDVTSAQIIAADAKEEPYILLAAQTTSAAFIKSFGFPKTLGTKAGEILPYPLPTGGILYPYFLKFAEKPSPQILADVAELTGRRTIYFVLPSYWTNAKVTANRAELFAKKIWHLEGTTIFRFDIDAKSKTSEASKEAP